MTIMSYIYVKLRIYVASIDLPALTLLVSCIKLF